MSVQPYQSQKINFIYRNFPLLDVKNLSNIMVLKFGIPSHLKRESNRSVNLKLILKKVSSKVITKFVVFNKWTQNTAR